MEKNRLLLLIEAAIFSALAVILDLLPSIQLSSAISISIAMVPVLILSFRSGAKIGFISGFLWGLLQIVLGDAYILTPVQGFIDYFLAFSFIGLAGLFSKTIQNKLKDGKKSSALVFIIFGVFIGAFARYFWHFISGVFFFGEYAPEGMSAVVYSLIVNGITMIGAFVLCVVVTVILIMAAPRLVVK
ncbi:thiamine transporter [Aeribacillus pallidus]|nr:thiamine transporter [Aeribacillus pallidus]